MKLTSGHLLGFGIMFICLGTALSGSSPGSPPLKRSITDADSAEKRDSLLEADEDDDDDDDGSPTGARDTKPKAPKPKTNKKSASRRITLPDDYDKLQIPSMGNVKKSSLLKNDPAFAAMEAMGVDLDDLDLSDEDEDEDDTDLLLNIRVEAQVRSIREIDELNEEITIELDFILKWMDYIILVENGGSLSKWAAAQVDIEKGYKSLDPVFLKSIWKPDLFIENLVSITRPELVTKPIRLLYNPAGTMILSTRVSLKMDCEMEFHYYPADTQDCVFRVRSYSHTKKDLEITWGYPGPFLQDRSDHNFDVKLDKLASEDLKGSDGLYDSNYTETFQVLQFQISARRKLSYHLIQTYLPSAFFIFITWLSFLVPATMVEARIGICMTTLLTLTAMFASVRESTPTVSYVKAIDTWMVACIFFVFLTLLEFTLLTWRRHLKTTVLLVREDDESVRTKANLKDKNQLYDLVETSESKGENNEPDRLSRSSRKPSQADLVLKGVSENDVEQYGFIIFSALFILFNLVYWPWLLISSDYFNWEIDPLYNKMDDK